MTRSNVMNARAALTVCLALLAAVVAFPGAAFAHGNEQHVIGTVSQVTATAITVKTTTNDVVTVSVASITEFTQAGQAAKLADLKVGDRVVIHAMKHGDGLMAHTVQFAAPTPKKPN